MVAGEMMAGVETFDGATAASIAERAMGRADALCRAYTGPGDVYVTDLVCVRAVAGWDIEGDPWLAIWFASLDYRESNLSLWLEDRIAAEFPGFNVTVEFSVS